MIKIIALFAIIAQNSYAITVNPASNVTADSDSTPNTIVLRDSSGGAALLANSTFYVNLPRFDSSVSTNMFSVSNNGIGMFTSPRKQTSSSGVDVVTIGSKMHLGSGVYDNYSILELSAADQFIQSNGNEISEVDFVMPNQDANATKKKAVAFEAFSSGVVAGDLGGRLQINTKQDGGILELAVDIDETQRVRLPYALRVEGAGTFVYGVAVGSVTASGPIRSYSRTIAQLVAYSPITTGEQFYCSNCSPAKIVVSTGTSASNFADAVGGTFK